MCINTDNYDLKNTRGLQFELLLYYLFSKENRTNLKWNVEYRKGPRLYRQVDLEYEVRKNNSNIKIIVEAKYTSNQYVNYFLRKEKEKNGNAINKHIDNLLTEVNERQEFVGAQKSLVITNSYFDKHMHRRVNYQNKKSLKQTGEINILLVEKPKLEQVLHKYTKGVDLETAISGIDIKKYENYLTKTRVLL